MASREEKTIDLSIDAAPGTKSMDLFRQCVDSLSSRPLCYLAEQSFAWRCCIACLTFSYPQSVNWEEGINISHAPQFRSWLATFPLCSRITFELFDPHLHLEKKRKLNQKVWWYSKEKERNSLHVQLNLRSIYHWIETCEYLYFFL